MNRRGWRSLWLWLAFDKIYRDGVAHYGWTRTKFLSLLDKEKIRRNEDGEEWPSVSR